MSMGHLSCHVTIICIDCTNDNFSNTYVTVRQSFDDRNDYFIFINVDCMLPLGKAEK